MSKWSASYLQYIGSIQASAFFHYFPLSLKKTLKTSSKAEERGAFPQVREEMAIVECSVHAALSLRGRTYFLCSPTATFLRPNLSIYKPPKANFFKRTLHTWEATAKYVHPTRAAKERPYVSGIWESKHVEAMKALGCITREFCRSLEQF